MQKMEKKILLSVLLFTMLTFSLLMPAIERTFSSITPENSIDVTGGSTPALDGVVSAEEYADAKSVSFATSGGTCTVYFKHNGTTLYVAFNVSNLDAESGVQVFVDLDYDRASLPQTDDYRFTISRRSGADEYGENQGTGTGWSAWGPPVDWTGAHQDLASTWNAEFEIPYAKLGITAGLAKTIGIAFSNCWTSTGDHWWPTGADWMNPSTWGTAHSSDEWVTCGTVVAGSNNGYVHVYDGVGNLLWSYDTGADVASVAVSSDGVYIAVGSLGNKLYLFDRSGSKLWEKTVPIAYGGSGNGEESKSVAISVFGEYIVAGCNDALYVYKKDGTLHWSHAGKETCAGISPDGNYIAACEIGGDVHLFSIASSTPLWTKAINALWVATSNPGYVIASNSSEVCMFDNAGTQLWSYTLERGGFVRVDMPWDGLTAVAVNDDPGDVACYVWYFNLTGLVWKFTPCPPEHDFYSLAISSNGNIISMGPGNINGMYVFSHDGVSLQNMSDLGWVQSVDLCYDGQFGAFGDHGGNVWYFSKDLSTPLWNKVIGGTVHTVAIAYPYSVTIAAYCHSGDQYISVSIEMDGTPTGYNTPHTFTDLFGTHTFTVPNRDPQYHQFKQWSTGETSATITVNAEGTYTAYYECTGKGPRSDLDIRFYGSQEACYAALKAGEVDFIASELTYEQTLDAQSDPNLCISGYSANKIVEFDLCNNYTISTYPSVRNPLNDMWFRRALSCAVDKDYIVDVMMTEAARVINVPIPPNSISWWPDCSFPENYPWKYNMTKAEECLVNASFVDRDGDGIATILLAGPAERTDETWIHLSST